MRAPDPRHRLRRSLGHHLATPVAALRPEVNDLIGALDDIQIMFDDKDRVAPLNQAVKGCQQLLDIGEMQTRGWFVKDEQGLARPVGMGLFTADMGGQFQTLGLAAGQGRQRLAQRT